jgi:translocator protein
MYADHQLGADVARHDEAARTVWVLIAFLALSAAVLAATSAAFGAAFTTWYENAPKPAWELPLAVRTTVWYLESVAIATAAWLIWTYPQPGHRTHAVALFAGNLALTAVARPVLLASFPAIGTAALWLSVVATGVLVAILGTAAVKLRSTHRVARLLLLPCIVWAAYVCTVNLARAFLN